MSSPEKVRFEHPMDEDKEDKTKRDIMRRLKARQSVSCEPGMEGKFVAKGEHVGKAIAVFTSGGDAQGDCRDARQNALKMHSYLKIVVWFS